MRHENEYLTRAEVLETLALQDKSQPTAYRALQKLAAAGCPRIHIAGGRWKRTALYKALERLAS